LVHHKNLVYSKPAAVTKSGSLTQLTTVKT